jgi:poly(hydroxyalkanoate) depolymerase family esterase
MFNFAAGSWPFLDWNPWSVDLATGGQDPISPPLAGEFLDGLYTQGAQSLRYKLYIPSSYRATALPMVVMLHGCGQDANDFALGTGMNALAERCNCIIVYPEQSPQANWNRCWNWYDAAHHERDGGEPALIAGLTQSLLADYVVDRARVSVAGLSSGGAMAVILGRTHPDLFKAVGCHSGLAHGSAQDYMSAMTVMRDGSHGGATARPLPGKPVPTIVFHGDQDPTVHEKNGADVVRQAIECYQAQACFQGGRTSSCVQTGETGGREFTLHTHRGDAGDIIAQQWTIHGSGHAWSGGTRHGSYTDTLGPDASEVMMQFFLRQ